MKKKPSITNNNSDSNDADNNNVEIAEIPVAGMYFCFTLFFSKTLRFVVLIQKRYYSENAESEGNFCGFSVQISKRSGHAEKDKRIICISRLVFAAFSSFSSLFSLSCLLLSLLSSLFFLSTLSLFAPLPSRCPSLSLFHLSQVPRTCLLNTTVLAHALPICVSSLSLQEEAVYMMV